MNNLEKYNQAFLTALSIAPNQLSKNLCYQDIKEWDSVGHMALISELEDSFDIMMDTNDIIDFNSYQKGIEILRKYNISFE